MATRGELDKIAQALKSDWRRHLRRSLVVSAALTLLATLWMILQIRTQQSLEADQEAFSKSSEFAEELAKEIVEHQPSTVQVPTELAFNLYSGGRISIVPMAAGSEEGYLVVLGSYQTLEPAIEKARQLRPRIKEPIRIFWAINHYY